MAASRRPTQKLRHKAQRRAGGKVHDRSHENGSGGSYAGRLALQK